MRGYHSRGTTRRHPWRASRAVPPTDPSSRGVSQPSAALSEAPYGDVHHEISVVDLPTANLEEEDLCIFGCKTVASYNRMTNPEASIVVPGMPAKWTPLLTPKQLTEDCGTYYRDQNAAFYPKHPLEPAVQSILDVRAETRATKLFGTLDLFGCGSTLGNLLSFVRGKSLNFRILVEVVGPVVHLVRRQKSPLETIPDIHGYGHSFPDSYITWDSEVRGSSSHQRIVNYQLGGLGIFCLFEGDGPPNADDAGACGDGEPELKIFTAGQLKPQDSIFELKTRFIKRQYGQDAYMQHQLACLWLRQVPNLILAYHDNGLFTDIRVMDVRNDVSEWEKKESAVIRKFVALLRQIVDIARSGLASGCRMELTCEKGAKILCVRDQEPDLPQFLSQDTLQRWETWLDEDDTSHSDSDDRESSYLMPEDRDSDSDYDRDYRDSNPYDYAACNKECAYCGRCMY
ncbi:hypothetical protein E4U32_004305 [Claviceps aff. humidiphila group G2b]|nr:hypothetical protein E4U32_004305 [Claviceps aff. humidiphila group G2b]